MRAAPLARQGHVEDVEEVIAGVEQGHDFSIQVMRKDVGLGIVEVGPVGWNPG